MRRAISYIGLCATSLAIGSLPTSGDSQSYRSNPPLAPMLIRGELAPASPPIVSREKWRAKQPLPGMKSHEISGIILHNSGVRKNFKSTLENKMRGLQSFSQRPGQVSPGHNKPAWPDVPYHFNVGAAGRIAEGRDIRFAGDTNTNYDTRGYIQIVVEGDFDKEVPAPEQLTALKDLIVWLMLSWDLQPAQISVHKDHARTSCPGRNFMTILPNLLKQAGDQRAGFVNQVCGRGNLSQPELLSCKINRSPAPTKNRT